MDYGEPPKDVEFVRLLGMKWSDEDHED